MGTEALRLVNGDGKEIGSDMIPDPFKFDGRSAYSRDNFYTRATDANGQGESKYFKCNPSILAGIAELVASQKLPYKSDSDFIRNAIVHQLHWDAARIKDDRLHGLVNRTVMLARVQARQNELAELKELMTRHAEAMQMCVDTKDVELLEELLHDAEHDVEEVRETYKKQLTITIDKFRALLSDLKARRGDG